MSATHATSPAGGTPEPAAVPPVLQAAGVDVSHDRTRVLHDVDLAVHAGPAAVAVVGASGSGKTTLARALLGLHPPDRGAVGFHGVPLTALDRRGWARFRSEVQPVFQDGSDALDPRLRIAASIAEGLPRTLRGRTARRARVDELLEAVELDGQLADRRPGQLSGGQRQRVALARALAVDPKVLILDEPTSALDVTVQARILRLLEQLRDERSLSLVLISHDLGVVDRLCDRITVLERGRVIESGRTRIVLDHPAHPSTAALRAAVPSLEHAGRSAPVDEPAAPVVSDTWADVDDACHAVERCPLAAERCRAERPPLRTLDDGRQVACHRALEQRDRGWQPDRGGAEQPDG